MNALEADLLDRSMGRVSDTLLRNRMMAEDRRRYETGLATRKDEQAAHLGLQRDELAARMADREDMRTNRKLSLEAQAENQKRLESIQKEGNETKRNQMYLEFLGELNKTGQLTDDGLTAMEQKFNEQFGAAGLGVKLFRRAVPATPISQDMGGGVRGVYMPGAKEVHVIDDRSTVTEDIDDMTGEPRRKVTRKLGEDDLNKAMIKAAPAAPEGDPLAEALRSGKTAPVRKEMDEHLQAIRGGDTDFGFLNQKDRPARVRELQQRLAEIEGGGLVNPSTTNAPPAKATARPAATGDRVTVISPDGKTRGSIPKAQLEQALKEGYTLPPSK